MVGILVEHLGDELPWRGGRSRLGAQRRQMIQNDFSVTPVGQRLTVSSDGFLRSLQTLQRSTATKPCLSQD